MQTGFRMKSIMICLFMVAISSCGSKKQDTLSATVVVTPVTTAGTQTSALSPTFMVVAQISDTSLSDSVTVAGGTLYYTTDGSTPDIASSKSILLDTASMTVSDSGYTFISSAMSAISTTTTIKYLAQVSFTQQIESTNMGMKKKSDSDFSGSSDVGSVTYTYGGGTSSSSSSSSSASTPAPVATASSVRLEPYATSGAYAPTADYCFALYAKTYDSTGSAVTTPTDVTFTLASVTGSGTFYSNSGCTSSITSSTVSANTSSTAIYYKDTNREAITLQATYNGTAGTAYSKTLGNPYIASMGFATIANGTRCQSISLYMKNASNQLMSESPTQTTTVVATRTSGATVNPHFYTDAACTNMVSESGNGISNISIGANSSGASLYFDAGSQGTYVYNLAWSCGSDSGTFTASFVFYHL